MNKQKSMTNIGTSLLLVVFLVLSLVTFASLSFSSSLNDLNTAQKNAERKKAYMLACNRAEEIMAEIDKDEIVEECTINSTQIQLVKDRYLSYVVEMDDSQSLAVVLEFANQNEKRYYRIVEWKTFNTQEWNGDQILNLLNLSE